MFFASGCHPRREESAHLYQLHDAYHSERVEIVAINALEDFENFSNAASLRTYLDLTTPPFTIAKGNY